MQKEISCLLLDASAWLDFFLGERPSHEAACLLVNYAVDHDIKLMVATTTVKDIFFVAEAFMRRSVSESSMSDKKKVLVAHELAWSFVEKVSRIATVVAVDGEDMATAQSISNPMDDLEDDLLIAVAMRNRADYLVTRDERLLETGLVEAITPTNLLALLQI